MLFKQWYVVQIPIYQRPIFFTLNSNFFVLSGKLRQSLGSDKILLCLHFMTSQIIDFFYAETVLYLVI